MAEADIGAHVGMPSDGWKFEYSLDGTTWVELDEVVSMDFPKTTVGKVPGSTLATPNRYKRRRRGWKEGTDINVKAALTGVALGALWTIFIDDTRADDLYFRQTYAKSYDFSDVGVWTYRGWFGDITPGTGIEREKDEIVLVEMTVVPTSLPSYSAAGP